ncbi:hypothetical protein WJX81_005715 [Elliptochloris bilobata]|uniref:Uncharacterized protein n=1 Tax=Elliptochloris bilobata TaxID=381761 RepID=A0AAW1RM44_9CHLO
MAVVQVTPAFSFGGGSTCDVKCTNVNGTPCKGAFAMHGTYGTGVYVRLDFLSMLPQNFQQICAGYMPLFLGGTQYVPNAAACTSMSYYPTGGNTTGATFQLNITDDSAVFTPPDWGRAPERIICSNVTVEVEGSGGRALCLKL